MKTKKIKIAVIADVHYGTPSSIPARRSEMADILLLRAVSRLNRLICPDITLVLGDLIDDGSLSDAEKNLLHIRSILDRLDSPYIAIPGNHDSMPQDFYRVFDRPREIEDIAGVRLLSFCDQEEPGCNARRSEHDLNRFRRARADYDGTLLSLQHVCLYPPRAQSIAPYNYTNADEIIRKMEEAGVDLSVSGHYHPGGEDTRNGTTMFVNAPGLCEAPFPFLEILIDGNRIETHRHELAMPEHLRLIDNHVHTSLAYCSENMNVDRSIMLAKDFGLAGITFTEHSGQLYFEKQKCWDKTCLREGMTASVDSESRMKNYIDMKRIHERDGVCFGLEVGLDFHGRILVAPRDRDHFHFLVGAMHALPSLTTDTPPTQDDQDVFLNLLGKLLTHGIDVLAHPFRVFRRNSWPAPPKLFRPTAQLLRKHQVAAEINFHTNEPPVEFIRECLNLGVKFSFGSDAHNLAEIGDFSYQRALLKDAGFDGDLSDVLCRRAMTEQRV